MLSIADLKLREGGNMVAKHFEGAGAPPQLSTEKCRHFLQMKLGTNHEIPRISRETVASLSSPFLRLFLVSNFL